MTARFLYLSNLTMYPPDQCTATVFPGDGDGPEPIL